MRRLLVTVVMTLGLAAPAQASTVEVMSVDSCGGDVACSKYGGGHPVPVTVLTGGAGEANRITMTREGDMVVFRDAGAPLVAGAGCTAVAADTARCPLTRGEPGITGLRIAAGDGDDVVTVATGLETNVILDGGPGADALTGGDGPDTIDGGEGPDMLDGAGGFDVLSYSARKVAVVIDAGAGTGGAAGETDRFSNFEVMLGGDAADRLIGGAGGDLMDGGPGNDRIAGAGGADELYGGRGSDRIDGGDDDDWISGDPPQGDDYYTERFRPGADVMHGGAGDDFISDDIGRDQFFGDAGNDLLVGGSDPEGGGARATFTGGAGNDSIHARNGKRDRLTCGGGRDRAATDRRDTRRSCERRLSGDAPSLAPPISTEA
jgi:Ca2+-binding RTX toxin-like protein